MERITAAEAARTFSDLLERVRHEGASFEVTRENEVVAHIVPADLAKSAKAYTLGELIEHIRGGPRLEPDDAERWAAEIQETRKVMTLPDLKWE